MTHILANGIDMHVLRMPAKGVLGADGRHPTVVLIHGLGPDNLASFYLTLAAPVSSGGVEVIAYDLRGHGRSSRPRTGYRLSDFVADLAELLGALDVPGPVHLVGNSFGGTVAFSYALAHPERVVSLVLIESEPATEPWSRKMSTRFERLSQLEHPDEIDQLTAHLGRYGARAAKVASRTLQATTMARDIPHGPLLSREQVQSVRCPMLMILGGESRFVDRAALASLLPRSRTVVVPGHRHRLLVEAPRAVLDLLLPWIAEHDPARPQAEVSRV
ncbi:MAG: alpha/beta fold hydrolase [Egibacteraceae bacterium]